MQSQKSSFKIITLRFLSTLFFAFLSLILLFSCADAFKETADRGKATEWVGNRPEESKPGAHRDRDTDGDGIPDIYDNCPSIANANQEDSDGDGIGDPCEYYQLSANPPESLVAPRGEPIWATLCATNSSDATITIIRPDCFNITTRWRRSKDLSLVIPRDRHLKAYGIPQDLITLDVGASACVNCDLSETVAPKNLKPGSYLVDHTYSNWMQDPDYDFVRGECRITPDQCYPEVWIGWMTTPKPRVLTLQGSKPAGISEAKCIFTPDVWAADWATIDSTQFITARLTLTNETGEPLTKPFTGLDFSSIRLNGYLAPAFSIVTDNTLTLLFNRAQAVSSLQTPVAPGRIFQTIQGRLKDGWFNALTPVSIVKALHVSIDIQPGRQPNTILLGAMHKVPVAIFSTPSFDATTIDPATVSLVAFQAQLKGMAESSMASRRDVNADGLRDLVVYVDTVSFKLISTKVETVLEGWTYGRTTPIAGRDVVSIVAQPTRYGLDSLEELRKPTAHETEGAQ